MIEQKDILLMVINLILGGVIGFVTSYFFYLKGKIMEIDMIALRYYQEEIFISTKYPNLFSPAEKFLQRYQTRYAIS